MSRCIGRFEVRRELGRGAQSVVYLAWDPRLQREVAIKTLHFSAGDALQNQQLLAEARTVSGLRHANIVPIFDVAQEDGDPYLVFEFVDGPNLGQVIRSDGPIPAEIAASMVAGILGGLAQAHAQGIIHRDLKPTNILVDKDGVARVMDFGIATRIGGDGTAGPDQEDLIGTAAFMAPEYVNRRLISTQGDVYAMGLILLEMLTGRRVFGGETLQRILHKVATEPVALPSEPRIEERLAGIAMKACARDPESRYGSAQAMKDALEAYLGGAEDLPPADAAGREARKQSTLDFLLRRMRVKSDFPVLSDTVSAINRLTNSDKDNINKLSSAILKDFALTNKILRIVNSAFYRHSADSSISTVSRAAIVLGFDAIRNIAVTVMLFEHLQDKGNARELKEAFLRANLAGLLGREAALKAMPKVAEESYLCSMFHGLGELLAQYYFTEETEAVRRLMQHKHLSSELASIQVLGISFAELGAGIARTWGFSPAMVNSMRRLPEGPVRKPTGPDEMLRVLATFSNEVCGTFSSATPAECATALQKATERFGASLNLSGKQVQGVVESSFQELKQVSAVLHVNLQQSPFARQLRSWSGAAEEPAPAAVEATQPAAIPRQAARQDSPTASTAPPASDGAGQLEDTILTTDVVAESVAAGASGEAPEAWSAERGEQAQAVLLAGIQDISNSLVEEFALNDILRIILETIYRAMGFERVILCMREPATNSMVGRLGFGPDAGEVARRFRFPLAKAADVFVLAATRGVDMLISNVNDPHIAARIPAWYRECVGAETFVLLPLVMKASPVALIYCDRGRADSISIPERELKLLKTLRNQAMLAIKQSA